MARSIPQSPRPRKGRAQKKDGNHRARRQPGHIEIRVNGVRLEVPLELERAVRRAYEASVQPLPNEMTTTQAAAFLDVSRPFIIKLIDQGDLPCRMVGTHRRIPSKALVAYNEAMFQRARKAANTMAQISQDLGLYDDPPVKGS